MALLSSPLKLSSCSSKNLSNERASLKINSISLLPTSLNLRKTSIFTALSFSSLRPCSQKTLCFSSPTSEPSTEIDPDISPETIVFVKGLAKSTSAGSLKTAFSYFGDVNKVKVVSDKKSGQSLGFAYVWFSTEEFAHKAVEEMNGKILKKQYCTRITDVVLGHERVSVQWESAV